MNFSLKLLYIAVFQVVLTSIIVFFFFIKAFGFKEAFFIFNIGYIF